MTTADNYSHPELSRLMADPSYHSVPAYRVQVETMRRMMFGLSKAMEEEGFGGAFCERVMSRILYNDPNGARVRRTADAELAKAKAEAKRRPRA